MPRYQIDYCHAVTGKATRRILFADCDSEVAELIALEGLRDVTVRPSLKLVALSPVRPIRPRSARRPIVTETISRPSDLLADTSGGGADWTREESEALRRQHGPSAWSRSEKQRARKFLSGEAHRETFVQNQEAKGRIAGWKRFVEAVRAGKLKVGRVYSWEFIKKVAHLNTHSEMLQIDLVGRTPLRLKSQGKGKGVRFLIALSDLACSSESEAALTPAARR
jgi:hypothetical protein